MSLGILLSFSKSSNSIIYECFAPHHGFGIEKQMVRIFFLFKKGHNKIHERIGVSKTVM
jgi:hypothetical protein